jgi:tartrate dehydratase beta subunit/fumarate hydratase class I family protein
LLVVRYPLTWGMARRLKKDDEIRYYGKIVYVSERALRRMEEYYKAEGSFPYDLIGELVLVKENSPIFIEDVLKMGASGIVKEQDLEFSKETLKLSERFERPFFETSKVHGEENVKLYADLENEALREIWVDSLEMRVIAGAREEED